MDKYDFYKVKDGKVVCKVSKEIYDKEAVLQVAYVLLEEMTMLIDADEKYFYMNIEPKRDIEPDVLVKMVLDELTEATAYLKQMSRTKEIRQILLEKALLSNSVDADDLIEEEKEIFGDLEEEFYKK